MRVTTAALTPVLPLPPPGVAPAAVPMTRSPPATGAREGLFYPRLEPGPDCAGKPWPIRQFMAVATAEGRGGAIDVWV
jgi:hypothetical protein